MKNNEENQTVSCRASVTNFLVPFSRIEKKLKKNKDWECATKKTKGGKFDKFKKVLLEWLHQACAHAHQV